MCQVAGSSFWASTGQIIVIGHQFTGVCREAFFIGKVRCDHVNSTALWTDAD